MRKRLPVIAAVLAVAAVALVVVFVIGGDDDSKDQQAVVPATLKDGATLKTGDFSLRYPKGWKKLTEQDLTAQKGRQQGASAIAAGVSAPDGGAVLLVEQRGKLTDPLSEVPSVLTKQLEKSVKDFKFVSSTELELPAGNALSYTFIREKTGRVQNLVVVPRKNHTFTLNSVIGSEKPATAEQVADIVKTFDPEE
jgi:hypothetical protein